MSAIEPVIWCFDCERNGGDPDHDRERHVYLTHGERDDDDPRYLGPDGYPRCLCGADYYLLCPGNEGPGSLSNLVIRREGA